MTEKNRVGVVIVTYNRLDKLKVALNCFERQSVLPKYLLVVDNASADGTKEYLDTWRQENSGFTKYVIRHQDNLGGSGGFYSGLERAMELDADWIWVSDDDAFPEEDALDAASRYLDKKISAKADISAICGAVINQGEIDIAHRKDMYSRGPFVIEKLIAKSYYQKDEFELNCFSYVGTIINKAKLAEIGLTMKDYFIWWDDTEHSLRLSKIGKIICVPAIRIHHDVPVGSSQFTWKNFYGYRNGADMYRRHFSKACYQAFRYRSIIISYLLDLIGVRKAGNKAVRCAMRDVEAGRLGIHERYKPGWKPEN